MGKITALSIPEDSLFDSEYELRVELFLEAQSDDITERAVGVTPMGYDNEIGLWEEVESRERKRELFV